MANIAVQRIKREFKEVLKSEEVRNELPDAPHLSPGRQGPFLPRLPAGPGRPRCGRLSASGEAAVSPPPPAAFPSPPRALGEAVSRAAGRPAWGGTGFGGPDAEALVWGT